MTRINLLPWREARRAQQQRDFITLLAAVTIVAVVGVIGTHVYIAGRIDAQDARNAYLQREIDRLKAAEKELEEHERTKDRLLGRLAVIQDLQTQRPGMVQVFDRLSRVLPEEIYLTSLSTTAGALSVNGVANPDNNILPDFMRNLAAAEPFGNPVLKVVESKEVNEVRANVFELNVARRKAPGEDAQDGQGGESKP